MLKTRIHALLSADSSDRTSRRVQLFIQALILINVAAFVLATVPAVQSWHPEWFYALEVFSVAVFTVEYLLRLYSCTEATDDAGRPMTRLRAMLQPMALIDLLAILPAFLPWLGLDLRSIRIVRTLRIFRVLKLGRYSRAMRSVRAALRSRREQLFITLFFILLLILFGASVLYFAEREVQPEVFSSIPAAAWWAVVTLTTVGYGDAVPITPIGRVAAALIAILGVGIAALPAGILGSAFMEQIEGKKQCPHCGKDLHD